MQNSSHPSAHSSLNPPPLVNLPFVPLHPSSSVYFFPFPYLFHSSVPNSPSHFWIWPFSGNGKAEETCWPSHWKQCNGGQDLAIDGHCPPCLVEVHCTFCKFSHPIHPLFRKDPSLFPIHTNHTGVGWVPPKINFTNLDTFMNGIEPWDRPRFPIYNEDWHAIRSRELSELIPFWKDQSSLEGGGSEVQI